MSNKKSEGGHAVTETDWSEGEPKKRLCVVSHSADLSGAERSLVTAVDYIIEHGWDVLVIVPFDGPLIQHLESAGARVRQFPFHRWILRPTRVNDPRVVEDTTTEGMRLSEVLIAERIDVVLSNTSVVNVGALAAAISGLPHIWHVREFPRPRSGCIPVKESTQFIRNLSNYVIFNSTALRDSFVGGEDWAHAKVIYNYVDIEPRPKLQPPAAAIRARVDVIVPFYNDRTTLACLESVIRNLSEAVNGVLVISDAGPDQALTDQVRAFVERHPGKLRWLENETNQGFVVTCNRGMSESANDVVLLNSDTVVTKGWVEKLRCVAYREERIATVTPLSNHASIFSVVSEPLTATAENAEELNAALELLAQDTDIEVPTAHGFCMYIKRAALDALGLFDAEAFGRGNGEENDFSLRARRQGWRNVASTDTYVFHRGAQSFGAEKQELMERHTPIVRSRYPEYPGLVDDFRRGDPFKDIRRLLPLFSASTAVREEPKLLVLGALLRHKRPLDAVLALGALSAQGVRAQLLLVGSADRDNEYVEELRRAANDAGISDRVNIPGEASDPRPLLAIADIVLLCSETESWGRTAVEAMLFRRPVVASRAGGIPEIVRHGETGLLYPTGDVAALAGALASLLEDPALRRQYGDRGREVAARAYSLETYGQGILDLIESARGQQNPAGGIARYLCELSQFTVRATPTREIIRQRITRPARRRIRAWISSARAAARRIVR